MSQFAGTGRGSVLRDEPRQLPRLAEQVRLNAPGVEGAPPNFEDARIANLVAGVIDAGASVAGGVVSLRTRQLQQQAAEVAAHNAASLETRARLDSIDEAGGGQLSAVAGPQLFSDIESGKLRPSPGESDEAFIRRIVRTPLPEGATPAFSGAAENRLLGPAAAARTRYLEVQEATAKEDEGTQLVASLAVDPTPARLERFSLAADGYLNDAQRDAALVTAMEAHARNGNPDAVATIRGALGDRAPIAVMEVVGINQGAARA